MFVFEGASYAVIASAVGSLLGVAAGLGMVRIMGVAFAQQDLELVFSFSWQNVVTAYALGLLLTFAVVVASSWRASRLNIVRSVRDLPEPRTNGRSVRGLVLAVLAPAAGILLALLGYREAQMAPWMLGVSLGIIGLPLLARRVGLPERAAFTIAGVGLVTWWLLPFDALSSVLPAMEQGFEMFFLSGMMLVVGAVWTVLYNADVLLAVLVRLLGRVRGLAPVLRTAIAHPMQNRFRTGMTLAMFSLIVFTLVVMGFVISGGNAIYEDPARLSGGYHVRAHANPANPVADIRSTLEQNGGVTADEVRSIAGFTGAVVAMKQAGTDNEPTDGTYIRGLDAGYTDNVTHEFTSVAEGYGSAHEVWQGLQAEPGTVVVANWMVPTRNDFDVGGSGPDFRLEGFFREDDVLPEVYITVSDLRSGDERDLRVIGVLKDAAGYTTGVMTSQGTLNDIVGQELPPVSFMFSLAPGVDAGAVAQNLEADLLEHGMQAVSIAEEIRKEASTSRMMDMLLQGFMGLGLLVGIAALGVIAARSVVERRQQIGILRGLGFQRGMVQLSFVLESSFIALLGIGIGVALGLALSYNLIAELSKDTAGLAYRIPWTDIAVVVVVAYGASLLTTYLPARRAARVYPAEALRYE
jgi:putative ABC transport system permease protein